VPQVDLRNRIIRLEEDQTKGEEARSVPLPSVLVNMLEEIQTERRRSIQFREPDQGVA